ncbi:hypothetical protein ACT3S4_00965 [Psychrobacter sp. AOP30-A2-5]|uniref:hypothetical protein n=1 Tax=Psychrobacter sp. AOP30-A2-5 TaxID=3457697 RepID=UPI004035F78C
MEGFLVILQILTLLGIGGIYFFKKYLFSYSSEKGKNLATKEDIEEITRKIENVKSEYLIELETVRVELSKSLHQKNEVWIMKRNACLKALNLANAILSNYKYTNISEGDMTPQRESIESARSCFNELACTCEGSEVIKELKKIVQGSISPDSIVDLRNAVRKELGFENESIDLDREFAFIGKINCDVDRS